MKVLELTERFGHGLLHTHHHNPEEEPMAAMTRAPRRESNAKPRHLRKDRDRLEPEPRRAHRYLQA